MAVSVKLTREEEMAKVHPRATDAAEGRVLEAMLPKLTNGDETRQKFRKMLRGGQLDDKCGPARSRRIDFANSFPSE